MKVAILIVNYNGFAYTRKCLESLRHVKLDKTNLEVIIIDNASSDDSVNKLKSEFPQHIYLVNQENLGFAEGNNVGIRYALKHEADFILLLNNDTEADQQLLLKLLEAALIYKKGGIFCPKIYFAAGGETHPQRYKTTDFGRVIWYAGGIIDWANVLASHRGVDEVDHGQYDEVTKTQFATGCALFVRREVFETVGLLDKKFYLYYEDVDFSLRVIKKGYEIYYVPQAKIWHKNAATAGGPGSELHAYYITRNRMLLGMRYAPWRTKLALFREATNLIIRGNRTQKQAIGDFLRKKYGQRRINFWHFPPLPNLLKLIRKTKPKSPTQ